MKSLQRILLVLPVMLGMVSCGVHDSLEDCEMGALQLRFQYKYHSYDDVDLHKMMDKINLYVFEQSTRTLNHIVSIDNNAIKAGTLSTELPVGEYSFIAWGMGNSSLADGGFNAVHMNDAPTHRHSQMVIGETTLDDFRYMIKNSQSEFSELFYANHSNVKIQPTPTTSSKIVDIDFDLIRYTNNIKVNISGVQYLMTRASNPNVPMDIFITGKKGTYTHDGEIDRHSPLLQYDSSLNKTTDNEIQVNSKLLRLDMNFHDVSKNSDNAVLLHIQDSETGEDMIPPIDVLKTITSARNENGEHLYTTQDHIDREEEFEFDVNILSDLSVIVMIDGFEIIEIEPTM